MIRIAWGSAAALAVVFTPYPPLAAAQLDVFPRSVNPATMKFTPQTSGDFVLVWDKDTLTCDSGPVSAAAWVSPHPLFESKQRLDFPVTIGFTIDEGGRALDIRVLEGGYAAGPLEISMRDEKGGLKLDAENLIKRLAIRDLMPSLRASRFAEDAPQTGCRVTYAPRYIPAEDVSGEELARIGVVPGARLKPAQLDQLGGGDCNAAGWPAPLLRAYPDWRLMTGREGARKWNWTRFDIDDEGVPRNVTIIASSGHDDLDRETIRAVAESRFAGGPRTGCVTPWWRNPETIPAPLAPATGSFPDYQDCNAQRGWATPPRLTFPPPYNDRGIEGWAVLGFDVNADGSIGDVTVLSAQPSAEFGEAGKAVLKSARFEPAEAMQGGCIQTVRFVLKADKAAAAPED